MEKESKSASGASSSSTGRVDKEDFDPEESLKGHRLGYKCTSCGLEVEVFTWYLKQWSESLARCSLCESGVFNRVSCNNLSKTGPMIFPYIPGRLRKSALVQDVRIFQACDLKLPFFGVLKRLFHCVNTMVSKNIGYVKQSEFSLEHLAIFS